MASRNLVGGSSDSANSFVQTLIDYLRTAAGSITDFLNEHFPSGAWIPIAGAIGVGAIMAMYLKSSSSGTLHLKIDPVIDLDKQSVEVSNDRARVLASIGSAADLKRRMFEDAKTMYELFRRGAKLSTSGECLGYRQPQTTNGKKSAGPYKWISYGDVIRRSEQLARGFLSKGLVPGQSTFVGIYSLNRPEWIITEQACYFYSMVIVPLYDTLGPDACSYIVNHADITLVVVDRSKKALDLLRYVDQCRGLKTIVLIEAAESDLTKLAQEKGVEIVPFLELEKLGSTTSGRTPPVQYPKVDDLATISYTSGTTGPPKGVMLTHGNVVADITSMSILKYSTVDSSDVLFSFLPLAHMFERVIEGCVFLHGGRVGYFSGDIRKLPEDMQALRPTLMAVVPRVLNRIYDKVMEEAGSSWFKKFLIERALKAKTDDLNRSIVRSDTIWDKIVFKRVRNGMGGRLRLMITGSAPLSPEILTFIRAAVGCVLLEGYGQTECVAACTVGLEGDHIPGHVGPPIPCCQIKLVDVPEMNYFANNKQGEVCVKGYNVFRGYLKDAEKTAEALDRDGWLHTGDIGLWTPSGTLKLIDRKKHIFKLAQGEYIAPEKLENVYRNCRFVGQIFVYGESLKSCLVAVVSPDPDVLVNYAQKELKLKGDIVQFCRDENIKKTILADLKVAGDKGGLQSFEQVKDVYLFPELFTMENGLLTPTLKMKRAAMKEKFKDQIQEMYKKLW